MVKNLPADAGDKRHRFSPWVGKISWRRKWHTIPVFLPGKSHGQRGLAGYTPWGRKESDMSEQLNNNNNKKNIYIYIDIYGEVYILKLRSWHLVPSLHGK